MSPSNLLPTWAPRLKQASVRQLYKNDAAGLLDEDLLNAVGWGLHARCLSFITAVEAARGRAQCPHCGAFIPHHHDPAEIIRCEPCDWQVTWQEYFATIQHKQLSGAEPVLAFFQEFVDRYPAARDPRDKMLLIDRVIHGWHYSMVHQLNTRATGINLIEGNYHQVIDFLDRLTYGPASTPGLQATWQEWRAQLNRTAETWNDDRLRRP